MKLGNVLFNYEKALGPFFNDPSIITTELPSTFSSCLHNIALLPALSSQPMSCCLIIRRLRCVGDVNTWTPGSALMGVTHVSRVYTVAVGHPSHQHCLNMLTLVTHSIISLLLLNIARCGVVDQRHDSQVRGLSLSKID